MDAQDNLKIIHTVDGTSLQNRYGKSVIQSHDIGLISLPTGTAYLRLRRSVLQIGLQ